MAFVLLWPFPPCIAEVMEGMRQRAVDDRLRDIMPFERRSRCVPFLYVCTQMGGRIRS